MVTGRRTASDPAAGLTSVLRYAPPYDWQAMRTWLTMRAIDGVEAVSTDGYRRTVRVDDRVGVIEVRHLPAMQAFELSCTLPGAAAAPDVRARVRQLLDLDRDPEAMHTHAGNDVFLHALARARPGLRVPGTWDTFELAVRAVLGQQVTVRAARGLGARVVQICGVVRAPGPDDDPAMSRVFPPASVIARADLSALGMPAARQATLTALAQAACDDPGLFSATGTLDQVIARLRAVKGIGEWTAHYIALRALRLPDAFPSSDIGLLRGAALETGVRPTPAALLARAERWRPFRAYAAQQLWAADPALPRSSTPGTGA